MGDKLTRRTLDAWIKSGDNDAWLWCGEQRGFGAHRRSNGTATFVVQFRVGAVASLSAVGSSWANIRQ